jgi:hypothetical protein
MHSVVPNRAKSNRAETTRHFSQRTRASFPINFLGQLSGCLFLGDGSVPWRNKGELDGLLGAMLVLPDPVTLRGQQRCECE